MKIRNVLRSITGWVDRRHVLNEPLQDDKESSMPAHLADVEFVPLFSAGHGLTVYCRPILIS